VLDADMLFLDDVSDWWEYCSDHDLRFCSKIKNYKRELVPKDVVHRRAFIDNNLTNPYYALHYFKKSDKALEFYKTLEFISNNWEWCYTKFAPVSYQNWLSMDLASAIAIEMTGFHDAVIDQTCPLEFVHMKPGIQGWSAPGTSWQDAVPYILNSKGELIVGNIRQSKLFHYVEKNFMSKKILSILKDMHNG
jgi:ABC-type amino acid transport substrate-binding protein